MQRLAYIDSLRGLAILGVLIVHCGQEGSSEDLPAYLKEVTEAGGMGVMLLFIISSFTLLSSLHAASDSNFIPFFLKRFFRIAPLYYLGILYFNFWGYENRTQYNISEILFNVTFTNSLSTRYFNSLVPGGWSISVEVLFYLLLPLLFIKIKTLRSALILLLLALIFRFIMINAFTGYDSLFLFFFLPNHLPIFGLGIVLYFLVQQQNVPFKIIGTVSSALFFSGILLQLMKIDFIPVHFLYGIAFLNLTYYLGITNKKIWINNLVFQNIGKISYSMYLWHFIVLLYMDRLGLIDLIYDYTLSSVVINFIYRFLLYTVLTMLFSYVTYKYIEMPFQNLGRAIIKKIAKKPQPLKAMLVQKE